MAAVCPFKTGDRVRLNVPDSWLSTWTPEEVETAGSVPWVVMGWDLQLAACLIVTDDLPDWGRFWVAWEGLEYWEDTCQCPILELLGTGHRPTCPEVANGTYIDRARLGWR